MKKKGSIAGYGKLLEAWVPPHGAGEPIGCMATSFTFSPVFFEEECLSRFLSLETDPVADGALYLIEREEKLSGVACAAALVDQNHARGSRSLRWDLLSARVPGRILHAKVSLLYWANLVRLIVSSANLTEDGYRRNREVFGVVDYYQGSEAPLLCLREAVAFLRKAVAYAEVGEGGRGPAVSRWNAFLDRVIEASRKWGASGGYRGRKGLRLHPVFVGPGYGDAFSRLREVCPGGVLKRARVASPFFDPPEAPNAPAKEIWRLLSRQGKAEITYDVTAEEVDGDNVLLLHAPESLVKAQPGGRRPVATVVRWLREDRDHDGEPGEFRPLHLKSLWLENDTWALYMIGSSNFTSAGLGFAKKPNLEANLVYCVSPTGNRRAYKRLRASTLEGEEIENEVKWQPRGDEGEDSPAGAVLLPHFFGDAVYCRDEDGRASVKLTFNEEGLPPEGWAVRLEGEKESLFREAEWTARGRPREVSFSWPRVQPPSGFEVVWKGSGSAAWWPVNIESSASLPPPAELRDLPLEVLIRILTSARPLHQVLRGWLKRKGSQCDADGRPVVDPHRRVDTSSFLLQRTRRVSRALTALRERLERPVLTREMLAWRLRGPVGVIAFADAIVREARCESEKPFLLAELALELSRVRPARSTGCMEPEEVKGEIRGVIAEIRASVSTESLAALPALKKYVERAFREAMP